MNSVSTLSDFHHWLLDGHPQGLTEPQAIVLSGTEKFSGLGSSIVQYLNEYDDRSHGHWMSVTPPLIETIAADATQRKLLGVDTSCEKCPPTGPCGLRKVIKGMATRGHVVIVSPHAAAATQTLEGVFHVSLSDYQKDCHIHLHADLFDERCLAPIIADVYLEWFQCRIRRIKIS